MYKQMYNHMNMLFYKNTVKYAVFTAFGLLLGCGSESESEIVSQQSEVDTAIETAITQTTVSATANFTQSIATLNTEIDAFCDGAADTAKLTDLQSAWTNSFTSWYALLPFKFGPLTISDNSSDILDYIDYYRNATTANQTIFLNNSNTELNSIIDASGTITESDLSNSRPKALGLLTLETAIFRNLTDDSSLAADIVTDFNGQPEKCDAIQALGYELDRRANDIQNQWSNDYRSTGISYQTLFTKNQLEDYFPSFDDDGKGTPASETVVVAIQEYLDFIGNSNIATELNRYTNDTIWSALAKSIESIESTLDQSANTELTIYAIMKNNGYEQDVETIKANILQIKETISNKNITDFEAAAKALDGNFKTSVIDGLNINKGLTFADGDS